MSTHTIQESSATPGPTERDQSFWTGRSELALVALLYLIAILLAVGTVTMNVQGSAVPGPQFFPYIVAALLFVTATILAFRVIRHPHVPDTDPHPGHGDFSADMLRDLGHVSGERTAVNAGSTSVRRRLYSDWRTLGIVIGGIALFIILLKLIGWVLSAAMLFCIVSYALGSKRTIFDLGVGLIFSSIIQLAFNGGLGLPLPPGFWERIF